MRLAVVLFAALVVAAGAQILYRGEGTSMLPTIRPGTMIAVYPYRYDRLRKGQLVLRWYMQKEVTHRLHEWVPGCGWKTKGDNNPVPDAGYLTPENFRGVAYVIPGEILTGGD